MKEHPHVLDADRVKGNFLSRALLSRLQINATYFHFKGEKCEAKVMERVLTTEIKYRKVAYQVPLLLDI